MSTIGGMISFAIFGIVAGLVARLIMPGRQPMGWIATMVLGIIGSYAGGMIAYLFTGGGDIIQPSAFLMSVVGAVVVLAIAGMSSKRSAV